MDVEELIDQYPRLFHLSEAGSWPTIAAHGLLPAAEIVSTSALSAAEQAEILSHPRASTLSIEHPLMGTVMIRDQTPLRPHILEKILRDMSTEQWLNTLNDRVFFWLHPQRLDQLLNARRNRGRPHDVLTVDTASLVTRHHERIRLSAINSGATLYPGAPERGPFTFRTIDDYPYAERRRRRTPQTAVVELAVLGGVPDIADHVVRVHRRLGPVAVADLWARDEPGTPALPPGPPSSQSHDGLEKFSRSSGRAAPFRAAPRRGPRGPAGAGLRPSRTRGWP
jgi:hypothetical protein